MNAHAIHCIETMTTAELVEESGNLMENGQLAQAEGAEQEELQEIEDALKDICAYLDFEASYEAAYEAGLIVR